MLITCPLSASGSPLPAPILLLGGCSDGLVSIPVPPWDLGSPQVSQHGDRAKPAHEQGGTVEGLGLLRDGGAAPGVG